jgi:hypothetical protein
MNKKIPDESEKFRPQSIERMEFKREAISLSISSRDSSFARV